MSVVPGSLNRMSLPFFSPEHTLTGMLDHALSEAEEITRQIRAAEAELTRVLATILDLAAAESDDDLSTVPTGGRAELAYRAARADLATALRISEQDADRRLAHAHALVTDYPTVLAALADGRVSEQHTRVIVDAAAVIGSDEDLLTETRRRAYEREILPYAVAETPNRLRPIAKRLAEQYAACPLEERHEQARARRRVVLLDREDGMADLIAHLPAVEAYGIHERLTRITLTVESGDAAYGGSGGAAPGGPADADGSLPELRRSRDEIRADVFADLLLGGDPGSGLCGGHGDDGRSAGAADPREIRARVQVVIPVDALPRQLATALGADHATSRPAFRSAAAAAEPAVLCGYGPISPAVAATLAAGAAHWDLVRTQASTGEVLAVDRYRPSARMKRFLRVRDQRCRFPGCRRPATRCDIDHTIDAAQGGPTATTNLAHLCRGHHTLKHHTGWQVIQQRGGVMEWRSPTGRVHRDRPPGTRVRFEPAPTPVPIPEPAY